MSIVPTGNSKQEHDRKISKPFSFTRPVIPHNKKSSLKILIYWLLLLINTLLHCQEFQVSINAEFSITEFVLLLYYFHTLHNIV